MKKNTTLLVIIVGIIGFYLDCKAQLKGTSFSLGYNMGNTKAKIDRYNAGKDSSLSGKGKHNLVTLGMMLAGKHAYFDMNLGLRVIKADPTGSYFNTKLAFGGYIAKTVGIMVGGQYSAMRYAPAFVEMPNNYVPAITQNNPTWHQRGAGVHLIIDGKPVFFRFSFMKDWILTKNGGKGSAYTPEAALYFAFDKREHDAGLQLSAGYSAIKLDAYEGIPKNSIQSLNLNVTLMLPLSICASGNASAPTQKYILVPVK